MACDGIVLAFKVDRAQPTWGMKTNEHSCGQISAIMHVTSRDANTSCHKSAQEVRAYRGDTSKNTNRFSVELGKRSELWSKSVGRGSIVFVYTVDERQELAFPLQNTH